MLTANLNELLNDVDRHLPGMVTVYEFKQNRVGVCCGDLTARQAENGVFLGTGDQGYIIDNRHQVIKEVGTRGQTAVQYRVLHHDLEILNIIFGE